MKFQGGIFILKNFPCDGGKSVETGLSFKLRKRKSRKVSEKLDDPQGIDVLRLESQFGTFYYLEYQI